MHHAFDTWMARSYPGCPFERYADDVVVHCKSRRQAEYVLAGIAARMEQVGLRLHPDKTHVVYCKESNRRGEHEHTSFTFLGFAFRPRKAINGKNGMSFTSFLPAISPEALKARSDRLRALRIHRRTDLTLDDLAEWLNPIIAGWMHYYGRYYRTVLHPLLRRVNLYLRRWAGKKYRRLRTHKRFKRWWTGIRLLHDLSGCPTRTATPRVQRQTDIERDEQPTPPGPVPFVAAVLRDPLCRAISRRCARFAVSAGATGGWRSRQRPASVRISCLAGLAAETCGGTRRRPPKTWRNLGFSNESPICSPNGSGSARPETLVRRAR